MRVEKAKAERNIASNASERILKRMGPKFDLSPQNIVAFATEMRSRITSGDVPFRKAYIRTAVERITVSEEQIVIRGRSDVLRKRVEDNNSSALPEVPSSVQEWRTQEDYCDHHHLE